MAIAIFQVIVILIVILLLIKQKSNVSCSVDKEDGGSPGNICSNWACIQPYTIWRQYSKTEQNIFEKLNSYLKFMPEL